MVVRGAKRDYDEDYDNDYDEEGAPSLATKS